MIEKLTGIVKQLLDCRRDLSSANQVLCEVIRAIDDTDYQAERLQAVKPKVESLITQLERR